MIRQILIALLIDCQLRLVCNRQIRTKFKDDLATMAICSNSINFIFDKMCFCCLRCLKSMQSHHLMIYADIVQSLKTFGGHCKTFFH